MQSSVRADRVNGFRRAELLFQKAIDNANGTANEDLYANLGTACLSGERIGHAIAAYRKALLVNPQHQQSLQNLQHARSLLPDWAHHRTEQSFFERISSPRALDFLAKIAAGCFILACGCYSIGVARQIAFLKAFAFLPLGVWLVLTTFPYFAGPEKLEAVVVQSDVVARSADSLNSATMFTGPLPDGTEIEVLDQRDDWLQISLNGQTAWIQRSSVELVSLP
ncbi:MAG: tetratricopeptide repeat protein [Planctomycetales bacterium]|nr:tetratricopeptide repeat protein [Planctomycetales bacterium]